MPKEFRVIRGTSYDHPAAGMREYENLKIYTYRNTLAEGMRSIAYFIQARIGVPERKQAFQGEYVIRVTEPNGSRSTYRMLFYENEIEWHKSKTTGSAPHHWMKREKVKRDW